MRLKTLYIAAAILITASLVACSDKGPDAQPQNISVEKTEYAISAAEEVFYFEVGGDMDFSCKTDADWMKVTRMVSEPRKMKVTVSANPDTESRTGEITIKQFDPAMTITVKVVQAAKGMLVLAKDAYTMASCATTYDFALMTNIEFKAESSADWLEVITPAGRALEERIVTIKAVKNSSDQPRQATLTVTDAEGNSQKVNFTQNGCTDHMRISMTHSGNNFAFDLKGVDSYALDVEWGDGNTDHNPEQTAHEYASGATRTVAVDSYGVEEITVNGIGSLNEITIYR